MGAGDFSKDATEGIKEVLPRQQEPREQESKL